MGLSFCMSPITMMGVMDMKKIKMLKNQELTFKEGCEKYLDDCRERNLREGTISHYKQSYTQFYKVIPPDLLLSDFSEKVYKDYVKYLVETIENDISINSYLRDLITTLHFLMREGYVEEFKMKAIKTDKKPIETYSEEELVKLLKKPNMKTCSFTEYKNWVMTNFLFSTGVRQRSLENIQIKDLDFDNNVVNIMHTKNRKPLIIPLNHTMVKILKEYLTFRQSDTPNDYLFCNAFGQKLNKSTSYHMLYCYNKSRGVEKTGIHRYRHTLAKQWILNGGDVVSLSKLLGHSSLDITQRYINYLVSDLSKQVDSINILDKFKPHTYIKKKRE